MLMEYVTPSPRPSYIQRCNFFFQTLIYIAFVTWLAGDVVSRVTGTRLPNHTDSKLSKSFYYSVYHKVKVSHGCL